MFKLDALKAAAPEGDGLETAASDGIEVEMEVGVEVAEEEEEEASNRLYCPAGRWVRVDGGTLSSGSM